MQIGHVQFYITMDHKRYGVGNMDTPVHSAQQAVDQLFDFWEDLNGFQVTRIDFVNGQPEHATNETEAVEKLLAEKIFELSDDLSVEINGRDYDAPPIFDTAELASDYRASVL